MVKRLMLIALLGASMVAMLATETKAALTFGGGGFTTVPAQCQDKKDNDGDGKIDYKNSSGVVQDLGCTGLTDNSENTNTTTSTALAFSATTSAVSSLNAIFPITCGEGTGVDCPRDLECSAFGKQAKGAAKFDNELRCSLTNITLGVRCNNKANNAATASFNSAHVSEGLISDQNIFPQDIDDKGKWTAVVTIFGSDIFFLAANVTDINNGDPIFTSALCPNEQNWSIDFSTATILQADVVEETFVNGVKQNTLDLGTCVLTDFVSGAYSCQ